MADLQHVLQALEPRLRRHRPLARAGQQLLFDIAGLLSGLRSLIMLDNAPGATPAMLQQVLEPVSELLPQFQGLILHLEGCCYLANSRQLWRRVQTLAEDTTSWPLVVSFSSSHAAITPRNQLADLKQQVEALAALLKQLQQRDHDPASVGHTSGFCTVHDLSTIPGLPVMPTLNGLMLGYPVVYWVRDLEEAEAASRVLSMSVLQLFTVRAACSCCCVGISQPLMSFTVPTSVVNVTVDAAVRELLGCVREKAVECSVDDDCAALTPGTWSDVVLEVEAVGPQPVSL